MENPPFWRAPVAEAIGVFALVFVGAGSIAAAHQMDLGGTNGPGQLASIALAHGLILAVMIVALGHISGGHFNPAVTLAAVFTRRLPFSNGLAYIGAQLAGGLAGAFLLVAALPQGWWDIPSVKLGTPALHPDLEVAKAVLVEAVLTFFLVLVVFGVGMDARNGSRPIAGLAIGLTVAADIFLGGPLTGAAMNPARAFGPAFASHNMTHQYVYWVGPILGGLVAALVYDSAFVARRPKKDEAKPAEAPSS